jgi:hypothetical protein
VGPGIQSPQELQDETISVDHRGVALLGLSALCRCFLFGDQRHQSARDIAELQGILSHFL